MIVRSLQEARQTKRRISSGNWESVRLVLAEDRMGFSFHITTIYAGTETPIWYQNHLESVYCIAGEGEVENCADGTIHPITPGMIYILDNNDRHLLRATRDLELACVFTPALHGDETHDESGAYPLKAPAEKE